MSDKLKNSEIRDIVIQAGMELIPYIGGSMATVYFGTKQEKRFKRLETFYQELANEIEQIKEVIQPINKQNPIAFEALLESLHDKVEVEPTEEKRQFFRNYFKNTLKSPVIDNYDERKYFLDSLGDMSLLECEILAFIKIRQNETRVGVITKPGVEQYAIIGAIHQLKSRGFLVAMQGDFSIGHNNDNVLNEFLIISQFGRKFCTFCLDDMKN